MSSPPQAQPAGQAEIIANSSTNTTTQEVATINFGEFNDETNSRLRELGITPDSPEILASLPFVNAYNVNSDRELISTSNYDFMIFQTQFDLAIKEIINKKIRGDKELIDLILTEYRDNFNEFTEVKTILSNYYLSILNVFNVFYLNDNLKSAFSEQELPSGNRRNTANQSRNVANLLKSYGMSTSDISIAEFLKKSKIIEILNDSSFSENDFFKNMVQLINNSLFGFPYHGFRLGGTLTNIMIPEDGIYGGLNSSSANLTRGLSLVSRSKIYSLGSPIVSSILSLDENTFSLSNNSYEKIKELGDAKIGNKNQTTLNGTKLVDKANISTSTDDFAIVAIEVFNKSVKNEKITPVILTGKRYFGTDIVSFLQNNEDLDILTYFNNLKSYFEKIRNGMNEEISTNSLDVFNSAIKTFATIIYEGLNLESLTIESNTIATNGNIDQLASLLGLLTFADDRFERNITLSDGSNASEITNTSDILRYEYATFGDNTEESPIFDLTQSGNVFYNGDFRFYAPFNSGFISLSQYDSLKSAKKRVVAKINYYDTQAVHKDQLIDTIASLVDFANSQSYISKYFIFDAFINFSRTILSRFSFATYVEGSEGAPGGPGSSSAFMFSSANTNLLLDQDGIDVIAALRDIANDTAFQNNNLEKILNHKPSDPSANKTLVDLKEMYRDLTIEGASAFNIANSFISYSNKIIDSFNSAKQNFEKITDIGIQNTCIPSIESLTNLNIASEKIYLPTSCFSPEPSFFTYLGSRNSKDLGIINSVLTANPNSVNYYESEETKVVAIGIPDGLIDRLRSQAGFSNKHTIIEISFYEVNHKQESQENEFSKVYSYYFNSCLHVNSVSQKQNINDILDITDLDSFNKTVYVDNQSDFENLTLDDEDILTFNFGEIKDSKFQLHKVNTFNDAIQYNKNFKISAGDIVFNDAFSNEIIRSHVINYGLKKKFEMFAGVSFDEFSFPQQYKSSININTASNEVIEKNVSKSGIQLLNYFENQEYTDDLKDYLKRTTLQSAVINSKYFLEKSFALSKFERVFLIPAYKSDLRDSSSDFDFKSLIPVVSIL